MSSHASDLWQQLLNNLRNLLAPGFCFVGSVGAKLLAIFEPPVFFDDYYQGSEFVEWFDKVFIWKAAV